MNTVKTCDPYAQTCSENVSLALDEACNESPEWLESLDRGLKFLHFRRTHLNAEEGSRYTSRGSYFKEFLEKYWRTNRHRDPSKPYRRPVWRDIGFRGLPDIYGLPQKSVDISINISQAIGKSPSAGISVRYHQEIDELENCQPLGYPEVYFGGLYVSPDSILYLAVADYNRDGRTDFLLKLIDGAVILFEQTGPIPNPPSCQD